LQTLIHCRELVLLTHLQQEKNWDPIWPKKKKKAFSVCARWKLKKARDEASKAGTGSSQQPGNSGSSKQGKPPTSTFKRPRSEVSTPTEMARTLKRPRDYKEALTNIKVAIFKETYPEEKLTKGDQIPFWKHWGRCYIGLQRKKYHT
jgi:hypothetical protein